MPLIRKEILEEIKDHSLRLRCSFCVSFGQGPHRARRHSPGRVGRFHSLDCCTLVDSQFLVEMLVWMMCFWTIWSADDEKKPKGSFILENGLRVGLDSHCRDTVSPRSTAITGKTGHDRCRHNLDIERPTPTNVAACSSCASLPRLLGSLWDFSCDADVF